MTACLTIPPQQRKYHSGLFLLADAPRKKMIHLLSNNVDYKALSMAVTGVKGLVPS